MAQSISPFFGLVFGFFAEEFPTFFNICWYIRANIQSTMIHKSLIQLTILFWHNLDIIIIIIIIICIVIVITVFTWIGSNSTTRIASHRSIHRHPVQRNRAEPPPVQNPGPARGGGGLGRGPGNQPAGLQVSNRAPYKAHNQHGHWPGRGWGCDRESEQSPVLCQRQQPEEESLNLPSTKNNFKTVQNQIPDKEHTQTTI